MFQSAFPIITTGDLERALGFYRDLLDGQVVYQFPPEGAADFVSLDIGSSHLGIGRDPTIASGDDSRQRFSLWVYTDDCDAAIERLRSGGVTIVEEPTDQPWGERVSRVLDPDGNSIVLGAAAAGSANEG